VKTNLYVADLTATRYTAGGDGIPSGYDGVASPGSVPTCGIEDLDRGVYDLFNLRLNLQVGDAQSLQKVKVIVPSGENWALIKRGGAVRDKHGALMLPLVSVQRTGISQSQSDDIASRGTNQMTGALVIKKRVSRSDPGYQAWLNSKRLKNQKNSRSPVQTDDPYQLTEQVQSTGQETADADRLLTDPTFESDHIWEIITIPSPQFYTAEYSVSMWCQYTSHMNQLIEQLLSSRLPQGGYRITTPNGYWFIATPDEKFEPEPVRTEITSERLIKCKFSLKVPAYVIASSAPGVPPGSRSYTVPGQLTVEFGASSEVNGVPMTREIDPDALADQPRDTNDHPYRGKLFDRGSEIDSGFYTGKTIAGKFVRTVTTERVMGESVIRPLRGSVISIVHKN